jgi:hypothetical protein
MLKFIGFGRLHPIRPRTSEARERRRRDAEGNAANVQLLDSTGLSNYSKNGRQYSYHGGLVKSSPYRLVIPRRIGS